MGRSNSCFRIITCAGGDQAEKETDDLDHFENKSSNNKRGWSFGKKSARHRVLSNHLISETHLSESKASLEPALLSSPLTDNSMVSEKACMSQPTEYTAQLPVPCVVQPTEDKAQLPVPVDSKASETKDDVSILTENIDLKASKASDDISVINKSIDQKASKKTDDVSIDKNIDSKGSETNDDASIIDKHNSKASKTNEDISIIEKNFDSRGSETSGDVSVEKNVDSKASETNEDVSIIEKTIDSKASETSDGVSIFQKDITSKVNRKESETDNVVTVIEKDIDCKVDETASETDEVSITKKDTDCEMEQKLDESAVIFIQAVVRGFLARREYLKLKKVVRLQATVRGHLVRRNAIGALRCIQAIVKLQALVRARCALSVEHGGSVPSGKENSGTRPKTASASLEKLLESKFARQLMDSTPKTKPIRIKCDTSKPNSAWNWLERWMSVSSVQKTLKPESDMEQLGKDKTETVTSPVEILSVHETFVPLEVEENLIAYQADMMNPCEFETAVSSKQPQFKNVKESDAMKTSVEFDSYPNQSEVSSNVSVEMIHSELVHESSVPLESNENLIAYSADKVNTPEIETAVSSEQSQIKNAKESDVIETGYSQPNQSGWSESNGPSSTERKESNPAFIAAQSKFEELTSSVNSDKSVGSSSYRDVLLGGSKTDRILSTADSKMENDGSGLSVSFTLNSPHNRAEVGAADFKCETKHSEQVTCDSEKMEKLDIAVKESTLFESIEDIQEKLDFDVKEPTLSDPVEDGQDILDHVNYEVEGSVVSEIEKKQEIGTPMVKKYPETKTSNQTNPLSPEAQATPASNTSSVKLKKVKTRKSDSNQKQKVTSSRRKKSPTKPIHDSGGISSAEQADKDNKSGKRRNSFGFDQEPKEISIGNNSVPRFMQPTESARAKVHEHNSPRSSPDVQERDKKRHSLPGADRKQGSSPRIQRSMSQAQQEKKERKWQR